MRWLVKEFSKIGMDARRGMAFVVVVFLKRYNTTITVL